MQEQKKSTLEYMMYYGALLGIFWVIQYLFFIGKAYWIHFIYFYHLLNVVSPLLMYIFYLKYKSDTPELKHNIWRCMLFVMGICFFGSFFEAAIRYAHYAFIDPNEFANIAAVGIGIAESWLGTMETSGAFKDASSEQIAMIEKQYIAIVSSKFPYIISQMIYKVIIGFIFSFLIALLTRNKEQKL